MCLRKTVVLFQQKWWLGKLTRKSVRTTDKPHIWWCTYLWHLKIAQFRCGRSSNPKMNIVYINKRGHIKTYSLTELSHLSFQSFSLTNYIHECKPNLHRIHWRWDGNLPFHAYMHQKRILIDKADNTHIEIRYFDYTQWGYNSELLYPYETWIPQTMSNKGI